jgi:hypothetical protein
MFSDKMRKIGGDRKGIEEVMEILMVKKRRGIILSLMGDQR